VIDLAEGHVAAVKLVLEEEKLGCKPVNLGAHCRFLSVSSFGLFLASVLLLVFLGGLCETHVCLPFGASVLQMNQKGIHPCDGPGRGPRGGSEAGAGGRQAGLPVNLGEPIVRVSNEYLP
jgi:hypothetical protein